MDRSCYSWQNTPRDRCDPSQQNAISMQIHGQNLPNPSDDPKIMSELMTAVAEKQDKQAFAVLFDVLAPRISGYLMRLGAKPPAVDDLVQDVMLTVWRRASQFNSEKASVATWVFTIARNRRIDVFRRESRPAPDPHDPSLIPEPEVTAEAKVATAEQGKILREAIAGLPAEQADLLHRAYFEDKSHSVIAAETNLPLGTIKSRLRLAMVKLRNQLEYMA